MCFGIFIDRRLIQMYTYAELAVYIVARIDSCLYLCIYISATSVYTYRKMITQAWHILFSFVLQCAWFLDVGYCIYM